MCSNLIKKKKKSSENAEREGDVFLENSNNCSGWELIKYLTKYIMGDLLFFFCIFLINQLILINKKIIISTAYMCV